MTDQIFLLINGLTNGKGKTSADKGPIEKRANWQSATLYQRTANKGQMIENGIRKADTPSSDKTGLWRGEDGGIGRKKSEFGLRKVEFEKYQLIRDPLPSNL